ncbi:hypothetical protein RJ640_004035 [Escallonia rubra]|uniref:Transmembrane protein n=1 Tax=Escallonia rubra TaxID=112253 RepID=A0AA88UGQ3_9ASTE|nr:hypothetical protein RJ640_004035 [Escallonia rubra]
MAGRITKKQKPKNEMGMGILLSPKPNLMQNCDLPPPLKVFSGPDKTVLSSMNGSQRTIGRGDNGDVFHISEDEKMELLRALHLSQTRATEAERIAASLIQERDLLIDALLHESSQLFAYRHWVKLLELQVQKLKTPQYDRPHQEETVTRKDDDKGDAGNMAWFVALGLCIGFAGIVIGCKQLLVG